MRRRIAAAAGALVAVAAASPVAAGHQHCKKLTDGGVICWAADHPEVEPRAGGPPRERRVPAAAKDMLWWPDLTYRPEVGFCIYWHRVEATGPRVASPEQRWFSLSRFYPLCPTEARPPTVRPAPQVVARQVVEEIDLPVPAPSIAPGFAITGKPAYLETGGDLRPPPFERPTELGLITVTARGTYVVDWGDGSPPERHTVEGRPWPEGTIRHTYTHIGRYDVVVAVEWTADWVVAGVPGTIEGLRTSATIAGFEVRQIQAVRDF